MSRSGLLRAFAVCVLGLTGCTTTSYIPRSQLARLDGFDARDRPRSERPVETLEGHPVKFDRESKLYLLAPPNQPAGGRFAAIRVRDDVFAGTTPDGRVLEVPLASVQAARVDQPPDPKRWLIIGGASMVAVAGLAVLFLFLSAPSLSGPQ